MTKKKINKLIKKFNSNADEEKKQKKKKKNNNKVKNLINKFEKKITLIKENTSDWEKEKIKKDNRLIKELKSDSDSENSSESELLKLEEEFQKLINIKTK